MPERRRNFHRRFNDKRFEPDRNLIRNYNTRSEWKIGIFRMKNYRIH